MRRLSVGFGSLLLVGALLAAAGCTTTVSSGPPPRRHPPGRARGWGHANPRLVIITGTGIEYVADVDEDIFVYGSVWYRFSGGVWFSCGTYGGTWVRIDDPPEVFWRIPPGHAKHRVIKGRKPPARRGPPAHGGPRGRGRGRGRWK